ncbi:uncharacterized protein PG998_000504 [Apiospora kogelbergensis]|uniref:Uncharacterized protein n=1 Tax=Apiospora kogelbergensis TaxID=1337665 RepID=A0AAW0QX57_9PEZI
MPTPPLTRPCSWIEESRYVFEHEFLSSSSSLWLRSSSSSFRGGPATASSSFSSPSSSPDGKQPSKYEKPLDPWTKVPEGVELNPEEIQRRYNLLTARERAHYHCMAKRGEDIREFLGAEAEVVLTTTGEEMNVKKIRNPHLFGNWTWDTATSQQKKAAKVELTPSELEEEDVENDFDEGDDNDDDDADVRTSGLILKSRDSIDYHQEWCNRRSLTEGYYRSELPRSERSPAGSITRGLRRVGQKLLSAVQSRRDSVHSGSNNSPGNAGDDEDNVDERLAKSSSKLKKLMHRFSQTERQQRKRQQRQKDMPKHEPCHRSRVPEAPRLKNAEDVMPPVPAWSSCIGPKNEVLEDLWNQHGGLPAELIPGGACNNNINNTTYPHPESRQSMQPGHWLANRC